MAQLDYATIERAICFMTARMNGRLYPKPVIMHSLRTGFYLIEHGFDTTIVTAGILHDVLEDTATTFDELSETFGSNVAELVAANSKDESIESAENRREELIKRCCEYGNDAVVIKVSDIYDNYKYYKSVTNSEGLAYCLKNKEYVLRHLDSKRFTKYINTTLAELK